MTKNPQVRYALQSFQTLDSSSENLSSYLVRTKSSFNGDSIILDEKDPLDISENESKLNISSHNSDEEEKSPEKYKQHKIFLSWLDKHGLGEIYDILHDRGYSDLESLLEQMHSDNPITEEFLQNLGISSIGLRYKLLILLEEESGIQPRAAYTRQSIYHGVATTMTFGEESQKIEFYDSLSEWLGDLKLEELIPTFYNNGYCSYEDLVMQMNSRYPLTDSMLSQELGISKPGHRSRILTKLQDECKPIRRESVILEQGQVVSCQLCNIY